MAEAGGGHGTQHTPLRPQRPLAFPDPSPCVRGAPRLTTRAAESGTCWLRRGAEGASLQDQFGCRLLFPWAPLRTGDSVSPPSSAGCNSYLTAPAWSVGRASSGRALLPRGCRGRARARRALAPCPAATRAVVAQQGREPGPRRPGVPGPRRARRRQSEDRPGLREKDEVFFGWEGQARHPGTPGVQVLFEDIPPCKKHVFMVSCQQGQ
ncbi:uncharacterized protein [Macaca fascicularis]|uniref:uncharacterized protein n=1 Tax=Macaca fascicularis TaxID=9541 RepID=UPI003D15E0EC